METVKRKIKWSLPHSYTLIFLIIVAIAGLTWIVPSGQFDRQEVLVDGSSRTAIIPGTYHTVPKISEQGDLRQGLAQIASAPLEGIINAADVVAFVLIVGELLELFCRLGRLTGH